MNSETQRKLYEYNAMLAVQGLEKQRQQGILHPAYLTLEQVLESRGITAPQAGPEVDGGMRIPLANGSFYHISRTEAHENVTLSIRNSGIYNAGGSVLFAVKPNGLWKIELYRLNGTIGDQTLEHMETDSLTHNGIMFSVSQWKTSEQQQRFRDFATPLVEWFVDNLQAQSENEIRPCPIVLTVPITEQ